jgi:hypothetical protein
VKDLAEMAVKSEKHYGRPMEPGGKGTDLSMMAGSMWGLVDMAGIYWNIMEYHTISHRMSQCPICQFLPGKWHTQFSYDML